MPLISIDVLKVHPRNHEFYDDISGKDYEQFKDSIKRKGILTDILVAPDMTILSGHQRFKAAKELGIKKVSVKIKEDADTEEKKLLYLLAANFGRNSNDPRKQDKVNAEYVALCGYKPGEIGRNHDQKVQNGTSEKLTLKEIASQLNTTEASLKRSLRIERNLSEPMKKLLDDGVISRTVAADVIASLSEDEQKQLIELLPSDKKNISSHEIKFYKDRIQHLNDANEGLKGQVVELEKRERELEYKIEKMENAEPEVKEVEVVPKDYEDLKKKAKEASAWKADYEKQQNKVSEKQKEILALQDRIHELENASMEGLDSANLSENIFYFCAICNNFISNVGGLVWLTERIADMPTKEKELFMKASKSFTDWALVFKDNLERSINNAESRTDSTVPLLTD